MSCFLIPQFLEINNILTNSLRVKKKIEEYLKLYDNKNTICPKEVFRWLSIVLDVAFGEYN